MKHRMALIAEVGKTRLIKHILIVNIVGNVVTVLAVYFYLTLSTDTILGLQAEERDVQKMLESQRIIGILLLLAGVLITVLLTVIAAGAYVQRLNEFKGQLHKAAAGDFKIEVKADPADEISELYDDLHIMIDSIQKLITAVYEEQVQKERLNSRQKDVEFKMLASQINPHFLYNTLETIRMKARVIGDVEIEELVKMLAKIMRRNIQVGDKLVTLSSELELVEYYLKIQQYRFGERIHYKIVQRCNLDYLKIMPLIIQPVVENAFIHGLETKEGEGGIEITVEKKEHLVITVVDDGVGMSKAKLEEIKENLKCAGNQNRSNIGLSNVNQRIKLLYGEEYGLSVESEENKGTSVTIEIPEDIRQ